MPTRQPFLLPVLLLVAIVSMTGAAEPPPVLPMTATAEIATQRWADLFGNYYATDFIRSFRYDQPGPDGPRALLAVDSVAPTFRGRLQLQGLKPNFVYQLKLRGDYRRDPEGFMIIGRHGRWRLPGKATHYTEADVLAYPRKEEAEAYILFDYAVTDDTGNADLSFALSRSFHVVWRDSHRAIENHSLVRQVTGRIVDARRYAIPKAELQHDRLWAEVASQNGTASAGRLSLPPRTYQAIATLTEESLHSVEADGGWWATVYTLPVVFTVRP